MFRLRECLWFIGEHPGASSRQVATGVGVSDDGQMSRLGARLVELDLAVRVRHGGANAWTLTARGERALALLAREPAASASLLRAALQQNVSVQTSRPAGAPPWYGVEQPATPGRRADGDRRARLLAAVISDAGEHGYAGASMAHVCQVAGVPRGAFRRHFVSLEDAFLEACQEGLGWLLDGVRDALAAEPDWALGVRQGLRALLERLAAERQLARACYLELPRVGARGAELRLDTLARLQFLLAPPPAARAGPVDRSVGEQMIAGGVWGSVHTAILADAHTTDQRALLSALHYHALVYHLGPQRALARVRDSEPDPPAPMPARPSTGLTLRIPFDKHKHV